MPEIYYADEKWRPSDPNSFQIDGKYGRDWSAFI